MTLNPSTFAELWNAWGPLLATVLGGMSLIIAYLVFGYREREKEIRCLRDAATAREIAANERYIGLLGQVLASSAATVEALRRIGEQMEASQEARQLIERVAGIGAKVDTALDRLGRGGAGT